MSAYNTICTAGISSYLWGLPLLVEAQRAERGC